VPIIKLQRLPIILLMVLTLTSRVDGASVLSESRPSFLARLDTAIASREPNPIAALADAASWRNAGFPEDDPTGSPRFSH